MKTVVKIENIDVSSKLINWRFTEDTNKDINIALVKLPPSVTTIMTPSNGQNLIISRGATTGEETTVFRGYIENINQNSQGYACTCKDKLYDLWRNTVTQTYLSTGTQAGKISEIFKDLVTTYGGLRADSQSITSSGTLNTLERFRCTQNKIIDKCKQLRDVLDWNFFYDSQDGLVYFEPRGKTIFGTTLTIGENITNSPVWTRDLSQCVNSIRVEGEPQQVETFEEFAGDGSTTAFTLSFRPINVRVEVDATLQVGGVTGGSASFDYSVDAEQGIINFESGSVPSADGNNVDVTYTYLLPIVVEDLDEDSIEEFKKYHRVIKRADIKTVNDAREFASNYLGKYSQPFLRSVLRLSASLADSVNIGHQVRVVDANNDIDGNFVIVKRTLRWPESYDTITVGDKEWRMGKYLTTTQFRIEELERAQSRDAEVQTIMRRSSEDIDFEDRYLKIQTETVAGTDIFILNHSDYGLLGTGKLGDADLGTAATQRIVQGQDTYKEYFYDDDFKDATNTTATWNNSARKATFDYKEQIQTSDVYDNEAAVNTVKFNIVQGGGSITFKIDSQLPGMSGVDFIEETE